MYIQIKLWFYVCLISFLLSASGSSFLKNLYKSLSITNESKINENKVIYVLYCKLLAPVVADKKVCNLDVVLLHHIIDSFHKVKFGASFLKLKQEINKSPKISKKLVLTIKK